MSNQSQFQVHAVLPSSWKVTFENGPINELDDFVDTFARRIAGFSKAGVVGAKEFVDAATAIPAGDHAAALAAFRRTAGRPENADHVRSLFERGLQQPQGIELDLGKHIAEKV